MAETNHKKPIVIYGVANAHVRRAIEFFLDDAFEIVGCSDSYYEFDILDGKDSEFFPPNELSAVAPEYIIIAIGTDTKRQEAARYLLDLGIARAKIVEPLVPSPRMDIFCQVNVVRKVQEAPKDNYGLVMGMSYSLRDIHTDMLRYNFFNFSWHGLDFYYNWKLYKYGRSLGKFSKVRKVFLCMPYYYFNHNQSMELFQYVSGNIFCVGGLNDWHNVGNMTEGDRHIAMNHIANYKLFRKKAEAYYRYTYHYSIWDNRLYAGEKNCERLDSIWWKEYPETIRENRQIFRQIIAHFNEAGVDISVIVPPFYTAAFDADSMAQMKNGKDRFYSILAEDAEAMHVDIKIYDFLEEFSSSPELFSDSTHLNIRGAEAFTNILNETLLR